MMIPPPTPVPRVIITALLYFAAAPIQISPNAAAFASFVALTGHPVSFDNSPATSTLPHPRFTHSFTLANSKTAPGTPAPIPITSSRVRSFSFI